MNGKCSWVSTPEGTQVTFEHTFPSTEKNQMLYIAFTYPFSYEECNQYFDQVQQKVNTQFADRIYIHRELLCYSLEDRYVELITLSGHNEKLEEREESISALFPEFDQSDPILAKRFSNERAYKFKKKCIFLSARVHPGEIQSSFVLNGIIDFLLSGNE